jgi:hypothetical protein
VAGNVRSGVCDRYGSVGQHIGHEFRPRTVRERKLVLRLPGRYLRPSPVCFLLYHCRAMATLASPTGISLLSPATGFGLASLELREVNGWCHWVYGKVYGMDVAGEYSSAPTYYTHKV